MSSDWYVKENIFKESDWKYFVQNCSKESQHLESSIYFIVEF